MRIFVIVAMGVVLGSTSVLAQPADVVRKYIETYREIAMEEMLRTGVPASIKLAQGIHETSAGTSMLVMKSNNHFGIKCKSNWKGASVSHDDDARGECFRKYPSAEESYRDHSDFLKNSARYAFLFSLDPEDYAGWAEGLKKAGYATNPKYTQALIRLVEEYNLQEYTLLALGKSVNPIDDVIAAGEPEFKAGPVMEIPALQMEPEMTPQQKADPVISNAIDYPNGVFKINDTKVVYVTEGTSFLGIAQQYQLPLARIFEFNDMRYSEFAEKGQLIYLQRKRRTGNNESHIVLPGETLHDIAQTEAIRLESLLELNWLKEGDRPAPGEKLSLQKKSGNIPRLALKDKFSLWPSSGKQNK